VNKKKKEEYEKYLNKQVDKAYKLIEEEWLK